MVDQSIDPGILVYPSLRSQALEGFCQTVDFE